VPFFDAHNHLQDPSLAPHLPQVLDTLEQIGVAAAVVNGTIDSDWEQVASLAQCHPWVIPSYGIHPWRIKERAENWETLLRKHLDKGGAIGEIGLDRWKAGYDFPDQEAVFRSQLRLAAERNLPATIHCLRAWGALWEIIRTEPVPACGFLLHAYGGPPEIIERFASRGAYFSFNGYFIAQSRHNKRETFLHIPLDRLLVESDAPSMPLPQDLNHHPLPDTAEGDPVNHPANVVVAYEGLAKLRGMETKDLERAIEQNFRRLFGPPRFG
jgi:TatD DNase family protein